MSGCDFAYVQDDVKSYILRMLDGTFSVSTFHIMLSEGVLLNERVIATTIDLKVMSPVVCQRKPGQRIRSIRGKMYYHIHHKYSNTLTPYYSCLIVNSILLSVNVHEKHLDEWQNFRP